MRKFILLLIALFTISVSAQTIESQKLFDNVEITLKGGVSALTHPRCNNYDDWGHTLKASTSIEFSKWITPKYGIGLESTVGWENGAFDGINFKEEGWNTFKGRNWVSYVDVLAMSRFNLNNIVHGYKGSPDKVEFIPSVGVGWVHGFKYNSIIFKDEGMIGAFRGTKHTNDIMTKYSVDIKFNLSNHFGLILTPYYAFNLTGGKFGQSSSKLIETNKPRFDSRNSWYGIEAGLNWRIGKQFTVCKYKYTQEDIDALNSKIDYIRNHSTVKEKVVERIVDHVIIKEVPEYVITFAKDSYELNDAAMSIINSISPDLVVKLIGGASPEGSAKHNMQLSQDRVYVVKSQLESRGIKVADSNALGAELGSRIVIIKVQ